MRIGTKWTTKVAVCPLVLTLALVGKVLSQDKPPAPAAPPAAAPAPAPPPSKPDPSGTATGGIGDVTAKEAGKPTLAEVAETAGHNKVSIDVMWILIAGFLVMFKVMDAVMGMRVSPEVEMEGLDVPEMGVHGYPEVQGPSTIVRHLSPASGAYAQVGTATIMAERS